LGSFKCAKLTSVVVEVGGAMDVVNVGPIIIIAMEEIILKTRKKR
jgi:hypothetical protein